MHVPPRQGPSRPDIYPSGGGGNEAVGAWETKTAEGCRVWSDVPGWQLVQRDDAHAAAAGGDEHRFGTAADNADLEGFEPGHLSDSSLPAKS